MQGTDEVHFIQTFLTVIIHLKLWHAATKVYGIKKALPLLFNSHLNITRPSGFICYAFCLLSDYYTWATG